MTRRAGSSCLVPALKLGPACPSCWAPSPAHPVIPSLAQISEARLHGSLGSASATHLAPGINYFVQHNALLDSVSVSLPWLMGNSGLVPVTPSIPPFSSY